MAGNRPVPQAASRTGSLVWVQGLVCGALLTFATPTAILLAVLFAPAAAAWLADTETGRPTARAVATVCLAPALSPLWHVWLAGGSMAETWALLSDPGVLGLAWISAACGWALCQILPVVLTTVWEMREKARAKSLREQLEDCRKEWQTD